VEVEVGFVGKPGKTKSATWKSPSLVSDPKAATTIPVGVGWIVGFGLVEGGSWREKRRRRERRKRE